MSPSIVIFDEEPGRVLGLRVNRALAGQSAYRVVLVHDRAELRQRVAKATPQLLVPVLPVRDLGPDHLPGDLCSGPAPFPCLPVVTASALRERRADIKLLAEHFLQLYGRTHGNNASLAPEALAAMQVYAWPGNVRELENLIHQLAVLTDNHVIEADQLPFYQERTNGAPRNSFRHGKAQAIEQFERAYITDLLCRHDGNVTRAARAAQKERRAFGRLIKKHKIVYP